MQNSISRSNINIKKIRTPLLCFLSLGLQKTGVCSQPLPWIQLSIASPQLHPTTTSSRDPISSVSVCKFLLIELRSSFFICTNCCCSQLACGSRDEVKPSIQISTRSRRITSNLTIEEIYSHVLLSMYVLVQFIYSIIDFCLDFSIAQTYLCASEGRNSGSQMIFFIRSGQIEFRGRLSRIHNNWRSKCTRFALHVQCLILGYTGDALILQARSVEQV